eukprot:COSAG03_NODE_1164_length_4677_cov_5.025120_2_plen_51_part_00
MRDFALQLCFELRNQCSFLALQCSALHQSAQLEQDSRMWKRPRWVAVAYS